jgi:hypothetical protein
MPRWDEDYDAGSSAEKEVQRIKAEIEKMPVVLGEPKEIALSLESSIKDQCELNFKRQEKRRVADHKHQECINIEGSRNSYFMSRSRVLLLLEEILGVELVVHGHYRPQGVEAEPGSSFLIEIRAPTHEHLRQAVRRLEEVGQMQNPLSLVEEPQEYDMHLGDAKRKMARISVDEGILRNEKHAGKLRASIDELGTRLSVNATIRGRGSSHIEPCFGEEADQRPYIQIVGKKLSSVRSAKRQILELLGQVHSEGSP